MSETFQDAIRAAGLEPPKHIAPGELHRFPGRDKPKTNRAGWCKLFADLQGGVFGDFSTGLQGHWRAKRPYTAQEKAEWQRQLKETQAQQRGLDKKEEIRQKEKSLKAWQSASPAGEHPYFTAKGIKSHGLRTDGRNLLIPLQDVEGTFQGLQWIGPEGHKGFAKGSCLQGSYFLIGEPNGHIYVAEGYATGASIHEATGYAVAIAFNASNLKAVAEGLRKKYPSLNLIVAADNDQWAEGNPGLRYAREAAEAVDGVRIVYPIFTEEAHETGPTDFNDLHQLGGIAAVKDQINNHTNSNENYPSKLILNKLSTSSTSSRISHKIRATEDSRPSTNPLLTLYQSSTDPLPGRGKELSSFGENDSGCLVEDGRKGPKLVAVSKAAKATAEMLRGKFAYDNESGIWHTFTGTHWAAESTPIKLHEQLSDWMYAETDPVGFSPSYTDSTLTQIQRSNMLPLPKPHDLIPFKNGLLDPRTRKLIPTTPNNALTWSLPYDYLPNAQCSTIQKWLHQMVGDEDTVQLLRAFMAALIRGPAKYQRFLHLIGPGGSGKSTFIRLLQMMTGQKNTVSTDLRQLEQNRFEAATLYGKQLALITDSDKYGGSINVLKALTGQDPIRLERKHVQQSGSFIFEGLVVMASNESLTTTDYTSGLERRRVTVPFENRVTEEEKQRWYECGGEDQLHQEIPGLINWLLSMPLDEMEKRITRPPAKVVKANTEAMRDSNPIADWVMENCTPTYGAWTQIGVKNEVKDMGQTHFLMAGDHLYPNYLRWCLQHDGRQSLSTRRFSPNVIDALKNCLGVDAMKTGRNGLMGIQGIRLRGEDEPVYEWLKNSQVEGW